METRGIEPWRARRESLVVIGVELALREVVISETAALDPFACTGRAAMALLDELIATAAVVV